MIPTKELRFGNKVQTRQGEVITVQQLLCNSLIYDTQIEVNREETIDARSSYKADYFTHMQEVIKEVDYHEVEPIALTPEILKKCGFRNFLREDWIISIGKSHIDFEFIDEVLRLKRPAPSLADIKYVHHLQNFLFAISAYELDVEL